jgi:hypothetical protein
METTTEITPELRKRLRAEWIAALRSGEYRQTTDGNLRDSYGWCCLGVACDVAVRHGITSEPKMADGECLFEGDATASLPPSVLEAFGIHSDLGDFRDTTLELGGEVSLSSANDQGVSFAEIADFIEQHPETVFEG